MTCCRTLHLVIVVWRQRPGDGWSLLENEDHQPLVFYRKESAHDTINAMRAADPRWAAREFATTTLPVNLPLHS